MKLRAVFAQNLKNARERLAVSQEELAHRAGIDRTYVSALERCKYSATLDVVERLAASLNVPADELLR